MHFAAQRELRNRTQVERAIHVFVIHHVVKGKTRIWAGRGQKLKESAVAPVFRVAVSTAVGIARTDPRLQHSHRRFPSPPPPQSSGRPCFIFPRTILPLSPQHEVELATHLGLFNRYIST